MNIKSLLFIPLCALLAASSASASNVLFSENWSGFTLDDPVTAGGTWAYRGGVTDGADRLLIKEFQGKRVLSSVWKSGDNFLPYAAINQNFEMGKGLSFDVTFARYAPTANYVRLALTPTALLPDGIDVPTANNMYLLDFGPSTFKVSQGATALTESDISYTSVDAPSPVGQFVTYSFQIMEFAGGVVLKVANGGNVLWEIALPEQTSLDFSEGVTAMIAIRSGANYISNVEVTAIPEASHLTLGAAVAALFAVGLVRRRRRS